MAHFLHILETSISIFRGSFPALRSVKIVSTFAGKRDKYATAPPWLHVIALSRPIPGILKTIVLECNHKWRIQEDCCRGVVGTDDEVVGSIPDLSLFLPGLVELMIRLDMCGDPERHAAYTSEVLSDMHDVLRFEYRARLSDTWKSYTVLPHDYPSDSESDEYSD